MAGAGQEQNPAIRPRSMFPELLLVLFASQRGRLHGMDGCRLRGIVVVVVLAVLVPPAAAQQIAPPSVPGDQDSGTAADELAAEPAVADAPQAG